MDVQDGRIFQDEAAEGNTGQIIGSLRFVQESLSKENEERSQGFNQGKNVTNYAFHSDISGCYVENGLLEDGGGDGLGKTGSNKINQVVKMVPERW